MESLAELADISLAPWEEELMAACVAIQQPVEALSVNPKTAQKLEQASKKLQSLPAAWLHALAVRTLKTGQTDMSFVEAGRGANGNQGEGSGDERIASPIKKEIDAQNFLQEILNLESLLSKSLGSFLGERVTATFAELQAPAAFITDTGEHLTIRFKVMEQAANKKEISQGLAEYAITLCRKSFCCRSLGEAWQLPIRALALFQSFQQMCKESFNRFFLELSGFDRIFSERGETESIEAGLSFVLDGNSSLSRILVQKRVCSTPLLGTALSEIAPPEEQSDQPESGSDDISPAPISCADSASGAIVTAPPIAQCHWAQHQCVQRTPVRQPVRLKLLTAKLPLPVEETIEYQKVALEIGGEWHSIITAENSSWTTAVTTKAEIDQSPGLIFNLGELSCEPKSRFLPLKLSFQTSLTILLSETLLGWCCLSELPGEFLYLSATFQPEMSGLRCSFSTPQCLA